MNNVLQNFWLISMTVLVFYSFFWNLLFINFQYIHYINCSFHYLFYLAGSVYVLPNFFHLKKSSKAKKTRDILHELYPTISEEEQKKQLMDGILTIMSYDAENTPCLNNFEVVKRNSNCVFARKARLWGSCEWDKRLTLGKINIINIKAEIFTNVKSTLALTKALQLDPLKTGTCHTQGDLWSPKYSF